MRKNGQLKKRKVSFSHEEANSMKNNNESDKKTNNVKNKRKKN